MSAEKTADPGKTQMAKAVADAQILLSHAAHHDYELDSEMIAGIVDAKALLGRQTQDSAFLQQEARFWQALNALSKMIAPVTLASLRAIEEAPRTDRIFSWMRHKLFGIWSMTSEAKTAVRHMRWWAVGTLILLLGMQIYWGIGQSLVTEIGREQGQASELNEQIEQFQRLKREADNVEAITEYASRIAQLQIKRASSEPRLKAKNEILRSWNRIWRLGLFPAPPGEDADAYYRLAKSLDAARFALSALQLYLLPLLYGLLGSTLFVLRTIAEQIKARTYTPEANIRFRIRMVMGALAGFVVVWFPFLLTGGPEAHQEKQKVFETVYPFALAFLVGYSIELLFAAMDRFILAFSGGEPNRKP